MPKQTPRATPRSPRLHSPRIDPSFDQCKIVRCTCPSGWFIYLIDNSRPSVGPLVCSLFASFFFFACSRGDWVEGVRRGSWGGGGRMHALSIFKTLSLLLSQQPRLPTPLSCPAYPAALRIFGRCCCCRCVLNKSLLNFIFSSQFDVRVVADILQAPRPQPAGQQIVCPIYVGKRC